MAFYADEHEVWKCAQHPSKRRRTGVCHLCLKDRLSALCPNCAALRPCSCSAATTAAATTTTTTSTSSSSSSSFSLQISDVHFNPQKPHHQRRISNLIDSEPPFQRSRSSAFPFFRSARFSDDKKASEINGAGKASFWSVFWWQKKGRRENSSEKLEMRRSRSVAGSNDGGFNQNSRSSLKGKAWYFPSPMKVFRHSSSTHHKSSSQKVAVHERSPLHRG